MWGVAQIAAIAVGRRLLRHLDGVGEIAGAVVDPRQQMAVEIDRAVG
jgi:hypothetical protein